MKQEMRIENSFRSVNRFFSSVDFYSVFLGFLCILSIFSCQWNNIICNEMSIILNPGNVDLPHWISALQAIYISKQINEFYEKDLCQLDNVRILNLPAIHEKSS